MIEKIPDERVFLTETEAAELVRLAVGTLQNKRVAGTGPPYCKAGGRVLYDREDLLLWVRSTEVRNEERR